MDIDVDADIDIESVLICHIYVDKAIDIDISASDIHALSPSCRLRFGVRAC